MLQTFFPRGYISITFLNYSFSQYMSKRDAQKSDNIEVSSIAIKIFTVFVSRLGEDNVHILLKHLLRYSILIALQLLISVIFFFYVYFLEILPSTATQCWNAILFHPTLTMSKVIVSEIEPWELIKVIPWSLTQICFKSALYFESSWKKRVLERGKSM